MPRWKNLISKPLKAYHDLHGMIQLNSLGLGYQPWTTSALRPSAIRLIVNEIIINRRRNALEFGAGISTLFLAKVLDRSGGMLTVVEHDATWLDLVRSRVQELGIGEASCRFIHAPLDQFEGGRETWYARDVLSQALAERDFDLVLVDGPIATGDKSATRRPICDFMTGRLCLSYAIFVDDIDRPKDLELAAMWTAKLSGNLIPYESLASIAVIRPSNDKVFNIC